jgi:hypothetical protein
MSRVRFSARARRTTPVRVRCRSPRWLATSHGSGRPGRAQRRIRVPLDAPQHDDIPGGKENEPDEPRSVQPSRVDHGPLSTRLTVPTQSIIVSLCIDTCFADAPDRKRMNASCLVAPGVEKADDNKGEDRENERRENSLAGRPITASRGHGVAKHAAEARRVRSATQDG